MKKIRMVGLILFLIVMMSSCNKKQEPYWWCFEQDFEYKIKKDIEIDCLYIWISSTCWWQPVLHFNNRCWKKIIYYWLKWKKEINIWWYWEDFDNYFSILEFYFKWEENKKHYAKIEWIGIDAKKYAYWFEYWKVYYKWKEVLNIDYESFEKIDDLHKLADNMMRVDADEYYAKDKNYLFYKWNIVEWFNIKKINYLKYWWNYIFKDDKDLYLNWKKISNSDSNTFKILKNWYASDKNNIYYTNLYCWSCLLKIIDKNNWSFEILNDNYVKNKNNVFYRWEKL